MLIFKFVGSSRIRRHHDSQTLSPAFQNKCDCRLFLGLSRYYDSCFVGSVKEFFLLYAIRLSLISVEFLTDSRDLRALQSLPPETLPKNEQGWWKVNKDSDNRDDCFCGECHF